MRLHNKLAVVTAAASGMGREGVLRFAREGARVAAIDIDGDALRALADEVAGRGHAPLEIIVADLSQAEQARDSIHQAAARLGGIDILWAHAGIPGPATVEGMDLDAYRRAIDLNVTSAVLAAGEVARHMRARGGGSLIFTASVSGLVGSMMSPVYSAAKFAVVGFAKSAAQRFAADGIRVNVVCPGLTETPMKQGFVGRSGDPEETAANERRLLAAIPMARFGLAHEVADAALWLASDEASYVTGVALPVDGGYTCR
ncbi:SDR family oxidoreductase [Flavobacterium sp. MXW15]|uniref:SDR family oxidoreductase n=1 Tax=Xanthomonas chitinilytica TaxID=2989819 RepID=A0ABT3K041_9XANT|nr:SDR family NAD(P)-dependent oxidoreductase [Xanthomonas sp. H13-6]MCW4456371.1 SDR family oxidoreductase [Flavobacterium sp. MXW15]MCW4474076.1 SDR family oxidoreductase [Xanthomonas sp. H13-6]